VRTVGVFVAAVLSVKMFQRGQRIGLRLVHYPPHTEVEAEVYVLGKDEGGRPNTPSLKATVPQFFP